MPKVIASKRFYLFLFVGIVTISAILLWWYKRPNWLTTLKPLHALNNQLSSISLQHGNDTITFDLDGNTWLETKTRQKANTRRIQTLRNYLQQLEILFPITGTPPDELLLRLQDSGIHITLHPEHGKAEKLTLGTNANNELLLLYHNAYYMVRASGYAPTTLQKLSLTLEDWIEHSTLFQRPSDMSTLWLKNANDTHSFCVQIYDSLHVGLYDFQQQQTFGFDTVRMSAFLYAVTALELLKADTLSAQTLSLLQTQTPLLELCILQRAKNDTLALRLYCGNALYPNNELLTAIGYVQDQYHQLYLTPLVAWDAIFTTRDALQNRN